VSDSGYISFLALLVRSCRSPIAESRETPEERRAREKAMVEESDHALSNELFQGVGSSSSSAAVKPKVATVGSGIASAALKTNQDHQNFALLVTKRFDNSTSQNISVFYKKYVFIF
jgi:hypothetical protein